MLAQPLWGAALNGGYQRMLQVRESPAPMVLPSRMVEELPPALTCSRLLWIANQRYLCFGRQRRASEKSGAVVVRDFTTPYQPRHDLLSGNGGLACEQQRNAAWNMRHNLRSVRHSLGDWKEAFRGKPAYLVGAGQSLEHTADVLTEVRRGVVIALHSAIRWLRKFDLYLCMTTEPRAEWWSEADFKDAVGVFPPYVDPFLANCSFRQSRFFRPNGKGVQADLCARFFPHLTGLDVHNDVALTALHLAYYLGCDPIVLVGMDYHDELMPPPGQGLLFDAHRKELLCVRDLRGEQVFTTYSRFTKYLAVQGAIYFVSQKCHVLNATGAGILDGPRLSLAPLEKVVHDLNQGAR